MPATGKIGFPNAPPATLCRFHINNALHESSGLARGVLMDRRLNTSPIDKTNRWRHHHETAACRPFPATAVAAAFFAVPAFAQESPTLKKIKETGSITLGHRESSILFSYYDDKQQVIGYSQEILLKIAEAVKADLKLAKLDEADAGHLGQPHHAGAERHRRHRMRLDDQQHRAPEAGQLLQHHLHHRHPPAGEEGFRDQGFPDLAGKNVVTTAGTTSERILKKMNEDKGTKMNIISAKGSRRVVP